MAGTASRDRPENAAIPGLRLRIVPPWVSSLRVLEVLVRCPAFLFIGSWVAIQESRDCDVRLQEATAAQRPEMSGRVVASGARLSSPPERS
eukprot:15466629-Alexandrium_andersonii.AAC.1